MGTGIELDIEKIILTLNKLEKRIEDRFPDSGLLQITTGFKGIAQSSRKNIDFIARPNIWLRLFSWLIIVIGVGGLIYSITYVDLEIGDTTFGDIVTISEAAFNDIVLLGAAIFFLVSVESRVKRKRAIKRLNELRAVVHVLDMHQLTKDPIVLMNEELKTKHSPKREYTKFELQRYLDYCSETSSLVAKVAALYSQSLPDEVIVRAVNDIETLSTGLSRKVWQKLIILAEVKEV